MLAAAAVALLGIAALVGLTTSSHASSTPPRAKNFSLAQLGGQTGQKISLATFAHRPVIINFFASWCAPCKRETPLLAKFYRAHDGKVAVLGIDANDEDAAALTFMRAEGVQYPVAADPSVSVTVSYGVSALPQTFFLNAQHVIVRHVVGVVTAAELASWAATVSGHQPG
jgi:cytochrome c biogenesis protein CcmG, thiol:disulfide interchange protein DsbE